MSEDEIDRAAILRRRGRLVAAALAGLIGTAAAQSGCDPEVVETTGGNGGEGATSSGAGGAGGEGGEPQPCLGALPGGGGAGGTGGAQPCLEAPIGGGGFGGGG